MKIKVGVAATVAVLVLSLIIGPAAGAAPTSTLVTGATIVATADNVRAVTHPGSTTTAVVAQSTSATAVAQAAAYANLTGAAVILSSSTTDPSAVNAVVQQKNIKTLTFVGDAGAFPASYLSGIDSRVTTKTTAVGDPFFRSTELAPAGNPAFVVASESNVVAMNAAVSYSLATSSALLVITGSEPANTVKNYLANFASAAVMASGDPGILDQLGPDSSADKTGQMLLGTPAEVDFAYRQIAQQAVDLKARAATKVVIAPKDDLASFALASVVARSRGAVLIQAGARSSITTGSAADGFLRLLRNELSSLALVGVSLTSAQLTAAAAPASVLRESSPAWTVTAALPGTGNYSVTYTARSGATRYEALNWDQSVMASSTTTSLVIPGVPDAFTLVAYGSTGNELERMYFRSNKFESASDKSSAMIGTIRAGVADLRFLGPANVPREIIRQAVDPSGMNQMEAVVVAVTCKSSFTDTQLNEQYEYGYIARDLTFKSGTGCGTTAGAITSLPGLPSASITLPVTQSPFARSKGDSSERYSPSAGQTISDVARASIVAERAEAARQGSATSQSITGSGFIVSYQGYIMGTRINGPGFSGDLYFPLIQFNASNRTQWDINNPGTKFDIRANIADNSVTFDKHIGQTIRYHCTIGYTACYESGRQTAPISGLTSSWSASGSTTYITLKASTVNPLEPLSVPIDGTMNFVLSPYSWTVTGSHDRMPVHQLYWGSPNADAYRIYGTEGDNNIWCLFGTPGCVAYVNSRF